MSHVVRNSLDNIVMEINFHNDSPFIDVLDGNWHYMQRYKMFALQRDEKYQLERISDGREIPPMGRFKRMLPLATMLTPHGVPVTLASSSSRYIMRVLEDLINWLSENVVLNWSFHINTNLVNIFFTSDDDAAFFRLSLVNPSF